MKIWIYWCEWKHGYGKVFCQIIYKNADAYPNLKVLYEAALVCSSTSVDCERGFSQYNLIKTNHRNLLKVNHVNQLAVWYQLRASTFWVQI